MPSPFPGMDPYLEDEALWPVFHHQLVMCLYQILLPGLVDRYRARVSQRHYVTEENLATSVVRKEHHEDYIEVRQRSDDRLITLVEVVSRSSVRKDTEVLRGAFWEAGIREYWLVDARPEALRFDILRHTPKSYRETPKKGQLDQVRCLRRVVSPDTVDERIRRSRIHAGSTLKV